jgi:hypothetical protein
LIKVNDYKAQNLISHPLKKPKHSEVNSDYSLISLKSEVFRLNSELSLEKSKQEKLVAQNLELQKKLEISNQNLYNEEIAFRKMKLKYKDVKNLLKDYDDQLNECQNTIHNLKDDYEMINSELVSMKKKIIRNNETVGSAAKRTKTSKDKYFFKILFNYLYVYL